LNKGTQLQEPTAKQIYLVAHQGNLRNRPAEHYLADPDREILPEMLTEGAGKFSSERVEGNVQILLHGLDTTKATSLNDNRARLLKMVVSGII